MADSNQNPNQKQEKLAVAAKMLAESPTFQMTFPMKSEQWAVLLDKLEEPEIDDYLLLLNEEKGMLLEVKNEENRKKQVNFTKYLQRLERLKMKVTESLKNKHG